VQLSFSKAALPAGGAKGAIVYKGAILTTRTVRRNGNAEVILVKGTPDGRTWTDGAVIASQPDTPGTDIGDGCLCVVGKELWFSYRDNQLRANTFSIRVAHSLDGGKSWKVHSTVATSQVARQGLWASHLFDIGDGSVLCTFDDEASPWKSHPGHQWLTGMVWDPAKRTWSEPRTVSRAHNPAHLSRDGMPSVVRLGKAQGSPLGCAFETVTTTPEHASQIMFVTSSDNGNHWSWETSERFVIFRSKYSRYSAYCPWLAQLSNGVLACVFTSNDRADSHDAPGTPAGKLHGDVMISTSQDQGKTWSKAEVVYAGGNRNYMPQLLEVTPGKLVCLSLDHAIDKFTAVTGTIGPSK
jgi:hypothetical protein